MKKKCRNRFLMIFSAKLLKPLISCPSNLELSFAFKEFARNFERNLNDQQIGLFF